MGWVAKLNGKGRIVIPSEIRDKLGLERGTVLVMEIRENEIVMAKLSKEQIQKTKEEGLKSFLSEG